MTVVADHVVDELSEWFSREIPCVRYRAKCPHPAAWIGTLPCCGRSGALCEEHRARVVEQTARGQPWLCNRCGQASREVKWRRL